VRWIRNKYRRLDRTRAAHRKLAELAAGQPKLFRHWAWVRAKAKSGSEPLSWEFEGGHGPCGGLKVSNSGFQAAWGWGSRRG
jgi:hypothetical protein